MRIVFFVNLKGFEMVQDYKLTLLASSNTFEGIKQCIAAFWMRNVNQIRIDDDKVYLREELKDKVRVVKKGKRYRFEVI